MIATKRQSPQTPGAASHVPRKRFSQNFLVDDSTIGAIVDAIGPHAGDNMVEIGPGLGALTVPLAAVVHPLHVVEIDRDLIARLRQRFPDGQVVIHEGNALEFDFTSLGSRLRVIGNLPYHISTPILFHLAAFEAVLQDIHVMLQKEVVDRMVALPGSSPYGRLSVMLQYRFTLEKVLDVPPACFRPAPRVDSSVVRMLPAPHSPRARDEALFGRVVAAAFAQRRKTLRNTLRNYLDDADFERLGIASTARAQELPVSSFLKMADDVADRRA
ncbi:MAG TPA: 16S rRNA (adenine(1518)-N(6)/adenine(1519)-N(6))-dimethyltransferase RsmA [Burkholderiales bacterium]|nr:16S rRNA (adenine(1518)-N(6)/adenine(1519)-N(6))-dimethyltransferase RsmA [Burkholderiales bacterium]